MISMNKRYKTRGGRNVRILCTDGPNHNYPVIALVDGIQYAAIFTKDGYYNDDGTNHELDIVKTTVSPVEVLENVLEGREGRCLARFLLHDIEKKDLIEHFSIALEKGE